MQKIRKWLKQKMCRICSFSYVLMFHHITEMPKVKKSACLLSFDFFKISFSDIMVIILLLKMLLPKKLNEKSQLFLMTG